MAEGTAPAPTPTAAPTNTAPTNTAPAQSAPKAEVKPGRGPQAANDNQPTPDTESKAASDAAKQLAKRKYKLKVDGQEREEELDDNEISVRLQKGYAADKRMQEAAAERKRIADFYELGKKDPFAAAKEMWGVDLSQTAQQRLAEQYRKELELRQLPPEERVRMEYEEKLQAERAQAEQFKKQIEDRETQELEARTLSEIKQNFTTALQGLGLPPTYDMLAEMARVQKMALENDFHLTPEQLATEVRNRVQARQEVLHKSVMGDLKGDALLKHLGDDIVREVIRAKLATQQAAAKPPPAAPVKKPTSRPGELDKAMTPAEKRRKLILGF